MNAIFKTAAVSATSMESDKFIPRGTIEFCGNFYAYPVHR